MQKIDANRVYAQAAQRAFARREDVCSREVVTRRGFGIWIARKAHTAFCRDHDLFAHAGDVAEGGSENLLGFTAAIDVGCVEERVAGVVRRSDRLPSCFLTLRCHLLRFPRTGDAPATVSEAACLEWSVAEGDRFHFGILAFQVF